jgi:hypothetical protein
MARSEVQRLVLFRLLDSGDVECKAPRERMKGGKPKPASVYATHHLSIGSVETRHIHAEIESKDTKWK